MNNYIMMNYIKNRKLKNKIKELEDEIQDLNICRTKRNIDLQKYILLQIQNLKCVRRNKNDI